MALMSHSFSESKKYSTSSVDKINVSYEQLNRYQKDSAFN